MTRQIGILYGEDLSPVYSVNIVSKGLSVFVDITRYEALLGRAPWLGPCLSTKKEYWLVVTYAGAHDT